MYKLTFLQFFTDPILSSPTWGTILICLASSLIGVLVFVGKRSLVGESLSHASYPGVVLGIFLAAPFLEPSDLGAFLSALGGAFLSAFLGLCMIQLLEKRLHLHKDTALCLVLALFLGLGVTLASHLQLVHPLWYQQIQTFLFGQAVTMEKMHVVIYAILSALILLFVVCRFREIELIHFDRHFSTSLGIKTKACQMLFSLLLILAIVIGMRSVGIVLISGMLIAPAVFARQCTEKLGRMFVLAACAGMISGFLGIYLSIQLPLLLNKTHPLSLPTGPMIVILAGTLAIGALLFSPKKGWISRKVRRTRFKVQCLSDHLLKILWKHPHLTSLELKEKMAVASSSLRYLLFVSRRQGWIKRGAFLTLTSDGKRRGAQIVRLHRLWEVYLRSELKVHEDRVHVSAEEMEHILTPEIEERLTLLLKNPKEDPHKQPIPKREEI